MSKEKYTLYTNTNVDRKAKKLIKGNTQLDKKLRKVFKQMEKDPFYKSLRTHKVNSPKWGMLYSSRVTKDIRLLWDFGEESITIMVVDIGGHEGSTGVY
jgi:mRNA-degrading endonuclease YafQ of YafQ-DinJ toxin-antitoxin module